MTKHRNDASCTCDSCNIDRYQRITTIRKNLVVDQSRLERTTIDISTCDHTFIAKVTTIYGKSAKVCMKCGQILLMDFNTHTYISPLQVVPCPYCEYGHIVDEQFNVVKCHKCHGSSAIYFYKVFSSGSTDLEEALIAHFLDVLWKECNQT